MEFTFGCSYYPELVPENEWEADLDSMRSLGLSVLRLWEFAWSSLEPREGVYAWDWADRFLDLAAQKGFQFVICTPTATPPRWLSTQYPEIFLTTRAGDQRKPGGRRDVDVDSPIYRHFAAQIARAMGERWAQNPAVLGWHIDNELMGPEMAPAEAHSSAATFGFRQWLKAKYGTVENLNRAWGTAFWSDAISDWGEIGLPENPRATSGHVLDYSRYFSHSLREFLRLQAEELREVAAPHQWISTNATAIFDRGIDHAHLAEPLDVTGWDAYFGAAGRPHPEAFAALAHDWFRSMKGKPFWIFETGSSLNEHTGAFWAEMRARGAAGVLFWHFRGHRAGAEQGMAFADCAGQVAPERAALMRRIAERPEWREALPETFAPHKTAFVFSPDCVRVEKSGDPWRKFPFSYLEATIRAYVPLRRHGVGCDVLRPEDLSEKLEGRRLLVMPSLRLLSRENAGILRSWVEKGGVLLASAKTAHQDEAGVLYTHLGEPLAELLGFSLDAHSSKNLSSEGEVSVEMADGASFKSAPFCDWVTPNGAEVLGRFVGDPLDGWPAALQHSVGMGNVFYAAGCGIELSAFLLRGAAQIAGVEWFENPFEDVGLTPHWTGQGMWIFNYSDQRRQLGEVSVAPGDFTLALNFGQTPHNGTSQHLPNGSFSLKDGKGCLKSVGSG